MPHVKVDGDQVVDTEMPEVGVLPDGRHVSGFDKLDAQTLKELGWLPLSDIGPPGYHPDTQVLERTLDVQENKVVAVYTVTDIPPAPELPEGSEDALSSLTLRDLTAILLGKGIITPVEIAQRLAITNDAPSQ